MSTIMQHDSHLSKQNVSQFLELQYWKYSENAGDVAVVDKKVKHT